MRSFRFILALVLGLTVAGSVRILYFQTDYVETSDGSHRYHGQAVRLARDIE